MTTLLSVYNDTDSLEDIKFEFITINLPKGMIGVILDKSAYDEYFVKLFQKNNTVAHILQVGDILYSINNKLINNSSTSEVANLFKKYEDVERILVIKRFKIAPIIHGYIQ